MFVVLMASTESSFAQKKKFSDTICLNHKEKLVADWINSLRKDYDKKPIALSKSLTFVAKTHIKDLTYNHPDTSICNLSSWSDKGNWTPCCYNRYVIKHNCMWKKPKELTNYIYRGYELVVYFQDSISVDSLAALWSDSQEVLDMILTRGEWSKKTWKAMGIGANTHYVSVWFGQRPDKAGKPDFCVEEKRPQLVINKKNYHSSSGYYIIFGSYNRMKDAKNAAKNYKKRGFKHAGVITKNNHYRLYLARYKTLKEAMTAKQKLPDKLKDSWILKH